LDFEQVIITVVGVIIGAAVGALIAWILKGSERKNAVLYLAEKLEDKRKQIADEVWKRGIIAVDERFKSHQSDRELHDQMIRSEMDARDVTIEQYHKDFEDFKKNEYFSFKRNLISYLKNQKFNQEILQTVAFGDTAHSTPYWMFGLDKPEGEEDKQDEGVFFVQSDESRELQRLENEERIRLDDQEDTD